MKIVLGAVISLTPFSAGMAWNWMQLAAGLRRLGHDVFYVEQVDPAWLVDSDGTSTVLENSVNRTLFHATTERFGLAGRAFQIEPGAAVPAALAGADLLINIAGHITAEPVFAAARRALYFDQDPVYTQIWHSEYGKELNLAAHDVFATVGLNIGTPFSPVPDCGIEWIHTMPCVVPELWEVAPVSDGAFTTVASWSSYREIEFQGEWYGSKYDEFRRYAGLAQLVDQPLMVLLRRHEGDEEGTGRLRDHGWAVRSTEMVATLDGYQRFLQESRAEIGIAKEAYVKASSGWISDRSAHYLASGRPVLAQSTGFERSLPAGEGLLSFASLDEAKAGVEEINRDYERHRWAARGLAESVFNYATVLPPLVEACMS